MTMKKHLFKLFIILLLASGICNGDTCIINQCADINTEMQWLAFLEEEKLSSSRLVSQLLTIHALREQRDLPNSMARISPNGDIKSQINSAVTGLRNSDRCTRRKVLSCMLLQNYDESLSRTAVEMALRLPDKTIHKWIDGLSKKNIGNRRNLIKEINENIQANP